MADGNVPVEITSNPATTPDSKLPVASTFEAEKDIEAADMELIKPMMKRVAAELTEAPTNWHQMVVFFVLSTDDEDVSSHNLPRAYVCVLPACAPDT